MARGSNKYRSIVIVFMGKKPKLSQTSPPKMSQVLGFLQIQVCMMIFFQEFYSADSESQKTFKTLELNRDMPEETFITEIINDMISYIQKW